MARKLIAWTVALGLALVLVALLVATGESIIRHAEIASPVPHALERDLPLQDPPADTAYHNPGLAVWPAP